MFGPVKIAPSILSADFMNMERDVALIEEGGAGFVHVDVMDGHFVPNLTIGVPFVAGLKKVTRLPLDVHLMISNPLEQLPWYLEHLGEGDFATVHVEALDMEAGEAQKAIDLIHEAGVGAGLVLKPDSPADVVAPYLSQLQMVLAMSVYPGFSGQSYIEGTEDKVARLAALARAAGVAPLLEVDGGIGLKTAGRVAQAGADVLVCGNAVMKAEDPQAAIRDITAAALAAREEA